MKGFFVSIVFSLLVVALYAQSPKRELRAVWIATVKNIDWPTEPGLSTKQQKDEYRKILDFHQQNGFNAVIVQVRPSSDAFYISDKVSWSRYLTGESGLAPDPYYDPLTYMIDEAHDRGMEFHAWFNPYRIVVDTLYLPEDSTHIFYQKPDWFHQYGNRIYFDPGIPEVMEHVTEVIKDVTTRYDVDAIHFDDYFYPYRIWGEEFPDSLTYSLYNQDSTIIKDDWRRENVNTVIKMLNDTIKSVKPWVKFGISPFSVWRNQSVDPKGSDSQAGQTNYDDLFADVVKWMEEGWIDYVLPQLYFPMDHKLVPYRKLLPWWENIDFKGHLYIGHGTYRIGPVGRDSAWWNPSEIPDQIRLNRNSAKVKGSSHYSSKWFFDNTLGITDSLRTDLYKNKALVPTMPWLDNEAPVAPDSLTVRNDKTGIYLNWAPSDSTAMYYVIYRFKGKEVGDLENSANILEIKRASSPFFIDKNVLKRKKYTYAVTAVDRLYNESEMITAPYIKRTLKKKK
ncbi:MAG: family 10 glycosylhydrolase [Bacteroidota bacterium]